VDAARLDTLEAEIRGQSSTASSTAGGEPTITLDVREEAVDILTRAVDNYWLLEDSVTPAIAAFDQAQHASPTP